MDLSRLDSNIQFWRRLLAQSVRTYGRLYVSSGQRPRIWGGDTFTVEQLKQRDFQRKCVSTIDRFARRKAELLSGKRMAVDILRRRLPADVVYGVEEYAGWR